MQLQLASEKEEMFIVHGYTGLGLAGEAVKKDIVPYLFLIKSLLKWPKINMLQDFLFKASLKSLWKWRVVPDTVSQEHDNLKKLSVRRFVYFEFPAIILWKKVPIYQ